MNIETLGWNQFFRQHFESYMERQYIPARISTEQRNIYRVLCELGELSVAVSGRLRNHAESRADLPTVGDWVAIEARPDEAKGTIHAVLPRKSRFSRKAVLAGGPAYGPGRTEEQVLAANVDTVFLVSGLDGDFNLRRIERYLTVAWDSGAAPVVVLNKSDLCENIETVLEEVSAIAFGVPIHAVSAEENKGMEGLHEYLTENRTIAFLGSSGVGKSSLINRLLGEDRMKIKAVREHDNRGRHTTTHRELLVLPQGGVVIDTPGLRELQLWSDDEGLKNVFEDIDALSSQCRFRDCTHRSEPGCAVREAISEGNLRKDRYQSYLKLLKEQKFLAVKKDQRARIDTKARWKKITVAMRKHKNKKQ
jgi:ribosome biogenesis GTPase